MFLTAVQANNLLRKGCEVFLAYVVDSEKEVPSIEVIPVVREFLNVFLEEFPGLPPIEKLSLRLILLQEQNQFLRHRIKWPQHR